MKRKLYIFMMLIISYFIVALPFKVMEIIPGFADIRPVTVFGPVFALFYGLPGCIIFALMNLVMDIVAGDIAWSCIAGLIANFMGPLLFMLYWKRKSKTQPHLKTMRNIGHYCITIFIMAVFEAAIITPSVAIFYPDVDWKLFFNSVVLNTALFPILFGIPLTILMQEELGFKQIPSRK